MKRAVQLIGLFLFFSTHVISQLTDTYDGLWLGQLNVSEEMSMQIAFEITSLNNTAYEAKMNVIEQKAFDIPMDQCVILDDSIMIGFMAAGITYYGKYYEESDEIIGTYVQGGASFSLSLNRVDKLITEVVRPQTPARPFPYSEEEVTFVNENAGVTLAGTFTKPSAGTKFPAVILVAGSGRNDRNETPMGHFLLLSDYLTRAGYAVLRFDKRGVGESSGDYSAANTYDFSEDVRAALQYLQGRQDIDAKKIGILGHSEGAIIAPMIASEKENKIAFIIMLGGVGLRGRELLLIQTEKILRVNGASEEMIADAVSKNEMYYDIAMAGGENDEIRARLLEADPEIADGTIGMLQWNFFQTMLKLDPVPYLKKVRCPALAITGEKDLQCSPVENLAVIEKALKDGKCKDYTILTMPGLNHLLQTAKSGSPMEYEQIPEIISPDVLDLLVNWMNGVK